MDVFFGIESKKLVDIFNPSKIICVDAVQESIDFIKKRYQNNKLWKTECCIISNKTGTQDIYVSKCPALFNYNCATKNNSWSSEKRTLVAKRIVDIDKNVNIIKCDIEGSEWEIWDDFLSLPALEIIFIEIHADKTVETKKKINKLKKKFKLRFFRNDQSHSEHLDNTQEISESCWRNSPGETCHILAERIHYEKWSIRWAIDKIDTYFRSLNVSNFSFSK